MDDAWWGPAIPLPGGPYFCLAERSLPGCALVNGAGQRFVNESAPYVDAVHTMYEGTRRRTRTSPPGWSSTSATGTGTCSRGDPRCRPNPNVAPLAKAPFYAARIVPGDLGTKGGPRTGERARVLREDRSVIDGLYAAGNASAAVMATAMRARRSARR
jgi:3-oxosteroid 1-dehydrogenase